VRSAPADRHLEGIAEDFSRTGVPALLGGLIRKI
jgi:hypothetical protein